MHDVFDKLVESVVKYADYLQENLARAENYQSREDNVHNDKNNVHNDKTFTFHYPQKFMQVF